MYYIWQMFYSDFRVLMCALSGTSDVQDVQCCRVGMQSGHIPDAAVMPLETVIPKTVQTYSPACRVNMDAQWMHIVVNRRMFFFM